MDKESLLKLIAESGYNVAFGAKKHFASYDMIEKLPELIGLVSIFAGVLALVYPEFAQVKVSVVVILMGVVGLYISQHNSEKAKYEEAGRALTGIHDQLKALFYRAKNNQSASFTTEEAELKSLLEEFNEASISKQLILSDWYAHYKFFWQHQIDWIERQRIEEGRKFRFWRDKVPLSFSIVCTVLIVSLLYSAIPFTNACSTALATVKNWIG
ncbi:SLATT domain-containing protein [Aliamphritea ceti]|uniref:SLATT domain-containing protein n=1 Tax=Aliamphritea ceti TaxID=1524258 RepID=UPI0021C478E1|nr:SLATT domain-containing protein [Aliamphritea ceti]